MTRAQALAAVRAADIQATLVLARFPDEADDELQLAFPDVSVQISESRKGLLFTANVLHGVGAERGMFFGRTTADPVQAARDALKIAKREGIV